MARKGATTLWERFYNDDRMDSMNHHFWGDISAWFIKSLAGIQFNPQGNDITRVDIKPSFDRLSKNEINNVAKTTRVSYKTNKIAL